MLTPEEIEVVKNTKYFGKNWEHKGEKCCISNLAIHRGAKFYYSYEHEMMVFSDYKIVDRAKKDLAEWLDCYTNDGIPSSNLLCERLSKEKSKIFKRATY